jgi:hypothetical protein
VETAGVPIDVLWATVRKVSARLSNSYNTAADPAKIQDMVWLPTEWEMFGTRVWAIEDETKSNQARLEFYTNVNNSRKKFNASKTATNYWFASQSKISAKFCMIKNNNSSDSIATVELGVAPAFCVQ